MARCFADMFDVVCANRFLHVRNARIFWHDPAVKIFFNVATPLLIHKSEGSSTGMSEALGSTLWPFSLKKSKNICLIWLDESFFIAQNLPQSEKI